MRQRITVTADITVFTRPPGYLETVVQFRCGTYNGTSLSDAIKSAIAFGDCVPDTMVFLDGRNIGTVWQLGLMTAGVSKLPVVSGPSHFFGMHIGNVLCRFNAVVDDVEFQTLAKDGLPPGWVAWHIPDGENVDNSQRCRDLRTRPIVVSVGGRLEAYNTGDGRVVSVPYPTPHPRDVIQSVRQLRQRQIDLSRPLDLNATLPVSL